VFKVVKLDTEKLFFSQNYVKMHFVYIGYGIAISILMLMDWPHLLPLCLSYSLFWRKWQTNQKWLQYSTL